MAVAVNVLKSGIKNCKKKKTVREAQEQKLSADGTEYCGNRFERRC